MAIGLPPEKQAQLSDSDAEALFEEAREIERRRRRRRLAGASAIAGVALAVGVGFGIAGGDGGSRPVGHGSGGAGVPASSSHQPRSLTETVAASSSVCSLATRAATGSACHRDAPPTIPTSWRPTIVHMDQVKGCLQRAGLTAVGGAVPPSAQRAYSDTPIATVLIAAPSARPTAVSFYLTAGQARHAYQRILPTVTRQGQGMARRGRVLYTWNNQPASHAITERGCIQAA